MNIMRFVPESVRSKVSYGCELAQQAYAKVCTGYNQGQEWAVGLCKKSLPENHALLAEKVVRAVPETCVLLSAFTRTGTYAMSAFLAAKTIYVLSPIAICAATKGLNKEDMDVARGQAASRLQACIEPFAPALATSSSVCAVFGSMIGILRCSPSLVGYSAIHGIMAWVGYKATNLSATPQKT